MSISSEDQDKIHEIYLEGTFYGIDNTQNYNQRQLADYQHPNAADSGPLSFSKIAGGPSAGKYNQINGTPGYHSNEEGESTNIIEYIAKEILDIETLESKNSDDLDFHDLHVGVIKDALTAALKAGISLGHDSK